jgi:hypothetical protein
MKLCQRGFALRLHPSRMEILLLLTNKHWGFH